MSALGTSALVEIKMTAKAAKMEGTLAMAHAWTGVIYAVEHGDPQAIRQALTIVEESIGTQQAAIGTIRRALQ